MTDAKGGISPGIHSVIPRTKTVQVTSAEALVLRRYASLTDRDQRVVNALLYQLDRERKGTTQILASECSAPESGDG